MHFPVHKSTECLHCLMQAHVIMAYGLSLQNQLLHQLRVKWGRPVPLCKGGMELGSDPAEDPKDGAVWARRSTPFAVKITTLE